MGLVYTKSNVGMTIAMTRDEDIVSFSENCVKNLH